MEALYSGSHRFESTYESLLHWKNHAPWSPGAAAVVWMPRACVELHASPKKLPPVLSTSVIPSSHSVTPKRSVGRARQSWGKDLRGQSWADAATGRKDTRNHIVLGDGVYRLGWGCLQPGSL